ncbi:hypothetical protein FJY63_14230, partial [Candidatus Sumerlaeota bacterium]|nr:hypothetical protein [Candidatus Sumerlaeota bacterium]
ELRPDDYQRVQQYLNEAQIQLQTLRLGDAIATARRAEALVRQASGDALRTWAQQSIKQAEAAIGDATAADADINAPQLLKEARDEAEQASKLFASAEPLYATKRFAEATAKYLEAKNLAVESADQARRGKFRLIDEAEAAVVEARAYGAWRASLEELTNAIMVLNDAKEAMAGGRYQISHQLARKAIAQASKLTASSKDMAFRERLGILDSLITEATRAGGRYFRAQELAALQRDIARLREQHAPRVYDTNARHVAEMETRLQDMLKGMPDIVSAWVGSQSDRIAALEKEGVPPTFSPRISEARKFLRFAELDYKRGKYRTAYTNLLVGRRLVDALQSDHDQEAYCRSARDVLDEFKDAMDEFKQYLSLDPKTLVGLTRGNQGDRQFVAIAGHAKPPDFRQRVEAIITKVQAIKVPAVTKTLHSDLTDMLNTARTAAIYYERLMVLSEFDQATRYDIIKKAYDLMEMVRNRKADLEKALLPRTVEAEKI